MHIEIAQALDLQQVERGTPEEPLGLAYMGDARFLSLGIDLGREEEPVPEVRLGQDPAELAVDFLGAGRGVHHPAALLHEGAQNRIQRPGSLGGNLQHRLR